jgi:two-component sensor histidine kinase
MPIEQHSSNDDAAAAITRAKVEKGDVRRLSIDDLCGVSLARQSSIKAKSVSDYDNKSRKRLAALNTAQDLLFDTGWKSASLQQIAERTIRPFVSENITIDLPDVALPAQHAQMLALAVHELMSNSARWGAAIRGGKVHFSGTVQNGAEENASGLYLRWEEKRPARFAAPRKSGSGRIMLDTALPEQFRGKSKTSWNRTGFVYEAWLTLPS